MKQEELSELSNTLVSLARICILGENINPEIKRLSIKYSSKADNAVYLIEVFLKSIVRDNIKSISENMYKDFMLLKKDDVQEI